MNALVKSSAILLVALLLWAPRALPADSLVVIVNPASGVKQLTIDDAINIFMGRHRKLPSGISAMPIDIGKDSPERRAFYQYLVKKDLAAIDAYWARLVYSGATSPPLRMPDGKSAVDIVADNIAAIAYVYAAQVDARVSVVLVLDAH